ncbi:Protein of unknown function [Gryllus bimaculatus]|nr:Protein of unknown function [Gryllus bimaculatus]
MLHPCVERIVFVVRGRSHSPIDCCVPTLPEKLEASGSLSTGGVAKPLHASAAAAAAVAAAGRAGVGVGLERGSGRRHDRPQLVGGRERGGAAGGAGRWGGGGGGGHHAHPRDHHHHHHHHPGAERRSRSARSGAAQPEK